MKKFLKRFAIIGGILLVVLVGAAAIIASIFEEKIGKTVISEVNKQLTSEFKVADFDLTVVSSFPNISVNLRGVEIADNRGGVLLEAENLAKNDGETLSFPTFVAFDVCHKLLNISLNQIVQNITTEGETEIQHTTKILHPQPK